VRETKKLLSREREKEAWAEARRGGTAERRQIHGEADPREW